MRIPGRVGVVGIVEAGRCVSSLFRAVASIEGGTVGEDFVRVYDQHFSRTRRGEVGGRGFPLLSGKEGHGFAYRAYIPQRRMGADVAQRTACISRNCVSNRAALIVKNCVIRRLTEGGPRGFDCDCRRVHNQCQGPCAPWRSVGIQ